MIGKVMFLFILFVALMAEWSEAGLPPAATKGSGESSYATTFKTNYDSIPVTRSGTTVTIGTIPVTKGGTGSTSLTANNVLLGNGASAVQFVSPGSSGNMLVSNGTTWASSGISGSSLVTSTGATSPEVQSVYFGSSADCSTACTTGTCTICNQVGNKITSVTFSSTGNYNLNGLDGTKFNCTSSGYGSGIATGLHHRGVSTTSLVRMQYYSTSTTVVNVGLSSVNCIGKP